MILHHHRIEPTLGSVSDAQYHDDDREHRMRFGRDPVVWGVVAALIVAAVLTLVAIGAVLEQMQQVVR